MAVTHVTHSKQKPDFIKDTFIFSHMTETIILISHLLLLNIMVFEYVAFGSGKLWWTFFIISL